LKDNQILFQIRQSKDEYFSIFALDDLSCAKATLLLRVAALSVQIYAGAIFSIQN